LSLGHIRGQRGYLGGELCVIGALLLFAALHLRAGDHLADEPDQRPKRQRQQNKG
jgi:hypothetical protein